MNIKSICDLLAALLALAASIAWFTASRHPVAMSSGGMFAEAVLHPANVAHNARILRGVRWNAVAALLTGGSALASFFSWLVGVLSLRLI